MKRGRIFIYLALIIIIVVAAGGIYLWMHRTPATPPLLHLKQPRNRDLLELSQQAKISHRAPLFPRQC